MENEVWSEISAFLNNLRCGDVSRKSYLHFPELEEAEKIEIEQIPRRSRSHKGIESLSDAEHPGLGEEGKYHSKKDEHPLPEGTTLTYALVGNQNCGKTTLFNKLTGSI